ncbi:unnamed protein product, partial [Linum tenue]
MIEGCWRKRFGEEICQLMHGGDMKHFDDVGDDLFAHKMAVKFNVFRPFVKGWIFGDVDC